MKSKIMILGTVVVVTLSLASCGGGAIASDAKKAARLECEFEKIMKKAAEGDESVIDKGTKLAEEIKELGDKLEDKYSSDSKKKKFFKAYMSELDKCK